VKVDFGKFLLAAGFDGYLSKPIEPETFVRTVEGFVPPGPRARRPSRGS
jgi:CheY-like chemotaxis protein